MSPNTGADDLTLVTTNAVTILVQTMNFPTNASASVKVFINPRNSAQTVLNATFGQREHERRSLAGEFALYVSGPYRHPGARHLLTPA